MFCFRLFFAMVSEKDKGEGIKHKRQFPINEWGKVNISYHISLFIAQFHILVPGSSNYFRRIPVVQIK